MSRSIAAGAAVLALTQLAIPQEARAAPTPPPIEAYAQFPAMSGVQLSQDGKRIAYVGTAGDDHVFIVREIGGPVLETVAANHRKVLFISFADPDHVLLGIRGTEHFGGDLGVAELVAVIAYNLKTHKGYQLFPKEGVVADPSPPVAVVHQNGHVYGYFGARLADTSAGGRGAGGGEGEIGIYKTDLDTQVSTLETKGDGHVATFAMGPDGEVAGRVEEFDHGKSWKVMRGVDGDQVFAQGQSVWGFPDLIAYGRTKGSLILSQPEDGDFSPPREIDLATGKISGPLIDGAETSVLRDAASGLTVGFQVGGYADDTVFLDPALDAKWQGVEAAFPGEDVHFVSHDDDFGRWVVGVEGPHDSGRYFLVDVAAGKAILLGARYPQIKSDQVGAFTWFDYTAHDGTKLRGVLTLPPGRDPKNLPFVMLPHGGPGNGSYDAPHFDWWAQAIASRGYVVFQPDYRGSGGLGRSFERSGWGQWGRLMETDISDAIPALAAKGIIDPKRGCIVGWSYGGYATLAGVTLQKGFYRCAAAGGAVSDLNDMMWWSQDRSLGKLDPGVRYWSQAMGLKGAGDPEGARYSPAKLAANVDVPVLLIHGKDDSVVPFRQAAEMDGALKAAHKDVELLVLSTSDHWIGSGDEANTATMLKAMVGFLEKYNPPD